MEGDGIPPSSPPRLGSISPQSPPFFEPQHAAFTSKSSSPPPLFSSDDSRESVDVTNYESPRIHKNKRKGAWWDNHESAHNSPEMKKTKFGRNLDRNFDSGVYMLSDATDSSDDLLPQHKSPFPDDSAYIDDHAIDVGSSDAHEMELDVSSCPAVHAVPAVPTVPKVIMSAAERAFNRQIDEGLDRDQETYDFEGQGLQDSDITRIGELKYIIKDPLIYDSERPTEGQFRSLEPDIRIILNKNRLHRLVPSLFNITYLTSLSLRGNVIEELPQEIRQLSRLESLYLAQNKLKYLPFDLLHLIQPYGKLARFTTMSSKLLEPMTSNRLQSGARPESSYDSSIHPLEGRCHDVHSQLSRLYKSLATCKDRDATVWYIRYLETGTNSSGGEPGTHTEVDVSFYPHHPSLSMSDLAKDDHLFAPRYIARTLVSYYDQTGTLLHGSPALPCSDDEKYPIIIETSCGTYGVPSSPWFAPPSPSKVHSLVTTTLTRSLQMDSVADLRRMISDDGEFEIPRAAEKILARAEENAAGGYSVFRECHMCHKKYVVARAEWIEFWKTNLSVDFLPLKVSVCSWGCIPSQMIHRPEKELAW